MQELEDQRGEGAYFRTGLIFGRIRYYNYYDSTKRILGCATVSRKEHAIAQTRELEATKAVLPQVLEQGGIFHVFM